MYMYMYERTSMSMMQLQLKDAWTLLFIRGMVTISSEVKTATNMQIFAKCKLQYFSQLFILNYSVYIQGTCINIPHKV